MKTTAININEIKRFPTVTNPIKADDLHTPQAYAYSSRRAIVTDCTTEQRAALVELLDGKESAEGVTFNNTKLNRDRLHIWQNSESRKERAAILGTDWQYIEGLNHGTQPGDLITCLDGTRGRVTKSDPESCVIEFETEDGQRLSVAGYFRYTPSEKSEDDDEDPLADIIREARKQESRTMSGLNYGPIKYLRDRVLYATNGKTTAENLTEYENNLHRVTDADTYAAYLLSSYDVFVDETQVYCDLRRAFPSLTFAELCRLIRDHMGENQQGNGIAAALVPDCVILASSDEYTRRTFAERHKKYNRRKAADK